MSHKEDLKIRVKELLIKISNNEINGYNSWKEREQLCALEKELDANK